MANPYAAQGVLCLGSSFAVGTGLKGGMDGLATLHQARMRKSLKRFMGSSLQAYVVCELTDKLNILWAFIKTHLKVTVALSCLLEDSALLCLEPSCSVLQVPSDAYVSNFVNKLYCSRLVQPTNGDVPTLGNNTDGCPRTLTPCAPAWRRPRCWCSCRRVSR